MLAPAVGGEPGRVGVVPPAQVPGVPLVDADPDLFGHTEFGECLVDDPGRGADVRLQRGTAGQVAVDVAVDLLVVRVQRDVVHQVGGVPQHGSFPRAERRHVPAGTPGHDQLHVRVDHAHDPRGLGGEPAVLVRRLVPDLPGTVHLVAQAPQLDPEWTVRAVRTTPFAQRGPAGMVAVLQDVHGLLDAAGAEVERVHRFHTGSVGPRGELVQPEPVGLHAVPGGIEPYRPVVPDTVLPAVAGHEVPAGVADDGRAKLPDQVEDVPAVAALVRGRVARLVDPGVHGTAHVFDERPEQPARHRTDQVGDVRFDVDGHGHPPLTVKPCWLP